MTVPAWTEAALGPCGRAAVWRVDLGLDDARRAACLALLCEEERGRAQRFARMQDRDRFIASHAALRMILASEVGADPAALVFETEAAGKPALGGAFRGALAFNLSHSGSLALVALAPAARIGVDVEAVRPLEDCLRIARSHFAPSEVRALSRLSGARLTDAFFACWTCKEAFVKATGGGLPVGLDSFAVAIPPAPAALVEIDGDRAGGRAWTLLAIAPARSYAGAVAIEQPDAACALLALRPGWLG